MKQESKCSLHSRCEPESNAKCRSLTIANIKVLERQFWARIIQKDFAIQCEHHGVLRHVHHTSHNIAGLPRAPIVLITLVPPLGLGTEESPVTGKARRTRPRHQTPTAGMIHCSAFYECSRRKDGVLLHPPVWPDALAGVEVPSNSESLTLISDYWILREDQNAISLFRETITLKI